MSVAIVYESASGNTAFVAQALKAAYGDTCVYCGGVPAADSPEDAAVRACDALLVGFWTNRGTCSEDLAAFLSTLEGCRVFLFGTAGFGGEQAYFDQIACRVAEHLPVSARLAGHAMCQGRMGASVRARYEGMLAQNPDDARTQAMIANFDAALAHPDDADAAGIVAAAQAALAGFDGRA